MSGALGNFLKRTVWAAGTLFLLWMFSGYLWEFIAITKNFISAASFRWVFVVGLLHYFTLSGLCFICCVWMSKRVVFVHRLLRVAILLLVTTAIAVPMELRYHFLKMPWAIREVNRGRNFYLKQLLKNGANPNARDRLDQPMLLKAASKGNAKLVETLLSYGADVDATGGEYQQTALSGASADGRKRIVEILLTHGADVNRKISEGMTPLMFAAAGYPEIVEILLQHGAEVNAEDDQGWTALMYAASYGNVETVEGLLKSGAKVDQTNRYCTTAFIIAALCDYPDVLSILRDRGADINAQNKYCMTGLMLASKKNSPAAVQYLLDIGADLNIRDRTGKTALGYARENNNMEIAELIEDAGGIE